MVSSFHKRLAFAAVVLVLVGAGGLAWYYGSRPPVSEPPSVPDNVSDHIVRQAVEHSRENVIGNPRSAMAWGELGYVFRANEINPEAVICFTQAARLDPNDARWPYLIAITHISQSGEVIPFLREAYRLENSPERKSVVRMRLAEALLDAGELDEAAQLYAEQLRLSPREPRVHLGLGMVNLARNNTNEAIGELEQAIESPFAHQRAARLLASAHRSLGHLDRADEYDRQAVTSPPDNSWPDPFMQDYLVHRVGRRALNERANTLEAQGQLWDAVRVCEELAQNYPDEPSLVLFGKMLARAGDLFRAEQALRDAIKLNGESVPGHFFLAWTLSQQARTAREGGLESQGERLDQEAVKEYQRCLQLKPGHAPASVDLGRTLQRLKRYPEAIEACREAVRISPQAAETHLALGEVLLAAGKAKEAIAPLEEAVRLSPPKDKRASTLLESAKAQSGR
jgi:tetratricopeptide (TPR) repeat protein